MPFVTVEQFVAATPAVPAEWITCDACGDTYLGDPANGATCPSCRLTGVED